MTTITTMTIPIDTEGRTATIDVVIDEIEIGLDTVDATSYGVADDGRQLTILHGPRTRITVTGTIVG